MMRILQSTAGEFVLGLAGLLILTVIGVYVVLKFRDSIGSDDSSADLLGKFQEMRHEGHIDEEEYRTIKTDLGGKLSKQSLAEPKDGDGVLREARRRPGASKRSSSSHRRDDS